MSGLTGVIGIDGASLEGVTCARCGQHTTAFELRFRLERIERICLDCILVDLRSTRAMLREVREQNAALIELVREFVATLSERMDYQAGATVGLLELDEFRVHAEALEHVDGELRELLELRDENARLRAALAVRAP